MLIKANKVIFPMVSHYLKNCNIKNSFWNDKKVVKYGCIELTFPFRLKFGSFSHWQKYEEAKPTFS